MKTFIVIVMALATLRTIVPFAKSETYHDVAGKFIPGALLAASQILALWWLCEIFFTVK